MSAEIVYYGVDFFSSIISLLENSKYFLLFAGSYIEGSAVMMTGGLLWRLGKVDFWPMYFCLFAGDFLSDLMWYFVGYFGARKFLLRWGYLVSITPFILKKVEQRFHRYHLRILIISKLTMGFGLAVPILATAGMLRVSLARYIIINVLAGTVWIFALVMLGSYFGNVLRFIPSNFQLLVVPFLFVGFLLLLKYASKKLETVSW
jgi:membrane protein DedA with SNARE-associated domain